MAEDDEKLFLRPLDAVACGQKYRVGNFDHMWNDTIRYLKEQRGIEDSKWIEIKY